MYDTHPLPPLRLCRFPRAQSAPDGGAQATRGAAQSGRLPSERHDVRELPEVTRVQLEGGHVGEITSGDEGRSRKLPFIMIMRSATMRRVSPFVEPVFFLLCSPTSLLRTLAFPPSLSQHARSSPTNQSARTHALKLRDFPFDFHYHYV